MTLKNFVGNGWQNLQEYRPASVLVNGVEAVTGETYSGGAFMIPDYLGVLQASPVDLRALEGGRWTGAAWSDELADGTPLQPRKGVRTAAGTFKEYLFYPVRANSTAYTLGQKVSIDSGDAELWLECSVGGTSGGSAPTVNAADIGSTVADGTVTWKVRGYHAVKGWVGAPARTNLILRSEEFDDLAWAKTRATVTANAATAPDGNLTADMLVEDTSADLSHYVRQNASLAASTTYALSFFAKAGTRSRVAIETFTGNGWLTSGRVVFDLLAGTAAVTTGSVLSPGITALPNGWFRCWVTQTTNATAGNKNFDIYLALTTNSTFYTGNGTSGLYLWGAQIDVAFPSPYIPTTSATVTRAATVESISTAGNLATQNSGVDLWVMPMASGQNDTYALTTRVDANNRTSIYLTSTTCRLVKKISGVNTEASASYTHAASTPMRVQAYWSSAGMGIRVRQIGGNWSAWATNANTDVAQIASTVEIGSIAGSGHFAANYPMTRFIQADNPKYALERLAEMSP